MKDEEIFFRILLRGPRYPAIVIDNDDIWAAFNIKELGAACYVSEPPENSDMISVVDCTGEEFLYMPGKTALIPGIGRKKWTKKRIIDLFNDSQTAKEENLQYPSKSLSNKKLTDIVNEICMMIEHNK